MIQKAGLFLASLAAALTLAVALAAAGFAPSAGPSSSVATAAPETVVPADALTTAPVQVDTVYVAPPPAAQTVEVHKVVSSHGEGDGTEGEGSDD